MNILELHGTSYDTDLSVIRVSGDDSSKFLQGQFSNDVELASDNLFQYSTFSTNQGKVIATLRVLRDKLGFLLITNKDVSDLLIDGLKKYILMSKVKIEYVQSNILAKIGKEASDILDKLNLEDNRNLTYRDDTFILNTSKGKIKSCLVIVLEEKNLDESIVGEILNVNVGQLIDMLNIFPRLSDDTSESYIPQVLNMEDHDAINYKKGCYTGQEIVARTHYLGKIKKKLFLCSMKSSFNIVDTTKKIHDSNSEIVGEVFSNGITISANNFFQCVLKINMIDKDLYIDKNKITIEEL
tara:strand:+ start:191 stop:1081 length:891 start_codon:yes stop_codon:yes gene_type:complete